VTEPSFDAAALVETALDFPIGEVCAAAADQRLRKYLDALDGEPPVLVRPVATSELQALPPALLAQFLVGALASCGQKQRMRFAVPDADPATLSRAWAALPLALQRTSSWGVAVGESCPVDAVFSASQGKPAASVASEGLVQSVQRYVGLLHQAPEQFRAMLAQPGLKTPGALDEAVRRAGGDVRRESAGGLKPTAPQPKRGKEPMANKERGAKPESREEWEPLDAGVVAELNRQYQAMEKSLRITLDERFAALEARQRAQGAQPGSSPNALAGLGPRLWIPLLALVVVAAALGGWYYFRGDQRGAEVVPTTDVRNDTAPAAQEPEPDPAPPPAPAISVAQRAVANGEATGQWAEELKALLVSDADNVSRALVTVAGRDTVPRAASTALKDFAARISRKETLAAEGAKGREGLRGLLLDCIAAESVPGAKVKIDGNAADVTPVIDAVKQRYDITSTLKDARQMQLQSEIILRWIASGVR
jgi:hypothetical protein